ncbi:MAG: single-stranded DNA-binding protein [Thermoanaerobaculia bacterium]
MVNKVILVGNLGRDPEMRSTQGGQPIASFSIATSRKFKDKEGNRQEQTEWHNIVCFGRQAEIAGQYLTKGKMVFVEGRLQTSSWDDKERPGKKAYKTEIICDNFQMLGSRGDGSGSGGNAAGSGSGRESAPSGAPSDPGHDFPDDDIPF